MYNPWYFNILFVNNFTFKICSYSGFHQYLLLSLDLAFIQIFLPEDVFKVAGSVFQIPNVNATLIFWSTIVLFHPVILDKLDI